MGAGDDKAAPLFLLLLLLLLLHPIPPRETRRHVN
jgi:hypothetical protein